MWYPSVGENVSITTPPDRQWQGGVVHQTKPRPPQDQRVTIRGGIGTSKEDEERENLWNIELFLWSLYYDCFSNISI